jgi:hypothetical protein
MNGRSQMADGVSGSEAPNDWDCARTRLRAYLRALGVCDPLRLNTLTEQFLERARQRARLEPGRAPTELAAVEMDEAMTEWFAAVLERIPTGVEHLLSTRGRLALLLADAPERWPDQLLSPGPWPREFVLAMQEAYLRAGPEFQLSRMMPRPLDLGVLGALIRIARLPYRKMLLIWLAIAGLLMVVFFLTH